MAISHLKLCMMLPSTTGRALPTELTWGLLAASPQAHLGHTAARSDQQRVFQTTGPKTSNCLPHTMVHYYPTPSPSSHASSSHASSILHRALDPVDAADAAVIIPVSTPLAEDTALLDNSPPQEEPVYGLFGLDRWASKLLSTVGSDFMDDFKRIRCMVLPPPPTPCPVPIKGFTGADISATTWVRIPTAGQLLALQPIEPVFGGLLGSGNYGLQVPRVVY
ncbi:hypothetical protein B0H10DRAFT_2226953 [Mycena sp. CBHHK59/15]|nr:hypothetical protein B0H10DRAFT_2226953 [Mycena sp. CBHHK59/15]